jgi:hypothetical protein
MPTAIIKTRKYFSGLQFLLDESNRRTTTSTLPGNRRSQQLTATNYHQATTKSIREITV